jgi:hypothetical protein
MMKDLISIIWGVNPELNQVEQTTMKMIVANRFQLSKFVSI